MQILPTIAAPDRASLLRVQAGRLESAFLSQMLAHAGLDRATEAMGGGEGGAQFASFLRDAQADAMVRAGGLGLTESLFRALAARESGVRDA